MLKCYPTASQGLKLLEHADVHCYPFATIQTFHCKKLDRQILLPLERTTEQEEAAFPNVVLTIFSHFGGRMVQLDLGCHWHPASAEAGTRVPI
jgi:hypothetical protein